MSSVEYFCRLLDAWFIIFCLYVIQTQKNCTFIFLVKLLAFQVAVLNLPYWYTIDWIVNIRHECYIECMLLSVQLIIDTFSTLLHDNKLHLMLLISYVLVIYLTFSLIKVFLDLLVDFTLCHSRFSRFLVFGLAYFNSIYLSCVRYSFLS